MSKQKSLFVAAAVAEDRAARITPWQPETDPLRLAVLGKLIEECNELAQRAARCIIHGLDENDPGTLRTNRDELQREMADVIACIETAELRLGAPIDSNRIDGKRTGFARWHAMIEGKAS